MPKRQFTADEYRIAAEVVREVWGDAARVDEIVLHRFAAVADAITGADDYE